MAQTWWRCVDTAEHRDKDDEGWREARGAGKVVTLVGSWHVGGGFQWFQWMLIGRERTMAPRYAPPIPTFRCSRHKALALSLHQSHL